MRKTMLTIWTEYDPSGMPLDKLGHDAERGDALCSRMEVTEVDDSDLPNEVAEFFDLADEPAPSRQYRVSVVVSAPAGNGDPDDDGDDVGRAVTLAVTTVAVEGASAFDDIEEVL